MRKKDKFRLGRKKEKKKKYECEEDKNEKQRKNRYPESIYEIQGKALFDLPGSFHNKKYPTQNLPRALEISIHPSIQKSRLI